MSTSMIKFNFHLLNYLHYYFFNIVIIIRLQFKVLIFCNIDIEIPKKLNLKIKKKLRTLLQELGLVFAYFNNCQDSSHNSKFVKLSAHSDS